MYLGQFVEEEVQNIITLLAAVPNIPETVQNISKVMNLVGINEVPYKLTRDLKFLNICFGLQS